MEHEHDLPRVPDYPPAIQTCACEHPVPVEHGKRKGAARTVCERCGWPVPLRFAL